MTRKIKDGDRPWNWKPGDDEKAQIELTTNLVKEYVKSIDGKFTTRDLYFDLGITEIKDKSNVRVYLKRLCDDGTIERWRGEAGTWRKPEKKLEKMDLSNIDYEPLDFSLPLNIDGLVNILPGNIITIAGDANVGKTAFLLNAAKDNVKKYRVHYFSSEMGPAELKMRTDKFKNFPVSHKNINFYERNDDFADVIQPGKNNLNIIDYLELNKDFWMVGKYLKDIHSRLKGALAVVGIQKKNPKSDDALGGKRALEKPRLALSMATGKLKILKAKNWIGPKNPNGKIINFKLIDGYKFIQDNKNRE